jgi:hypothetical protein
MESRKMREGFSLTPCFSPVQPPKKEKPYQRFLLQKKPLKRLALSFAFNTRLKPGVNDIS